MRRLTLALIAVGFTAVFLSSCSSGISIQAAANGGKAKCGRNHLR